MNQFYSAFSFIVGASTSMLCGAIGMHIATESNYRTTLCAKKSIGYAFNIAFRAGSVMGFCLVSLSLLSIS